MYYSEITFQTTLRRMLLSCMACCTLSSLARADERWYSYDASGSTKTDSLHGTSMVKYDALGRITSYKTENTITENIYDAGGRRIAVGTRQLQYAPDPITQRSTEHDLDDENASVTLYSGNRRATVHTAEGLERRLLYGSSGRPIAEEKLTPNGFKRTFLVRNQARSTVAAIDDVTQRTAYLQLDWPYGYEMAAAHQQGCQPLTQFAGHVLEGASGWVDFGARRYCRTTGRFLAIDPEARRYAGLSPFGYAANNPVLNGDAGGRFILWDLSAVPESDQDSVASLIVGIANNSRMFARVNNSLDASQEQVYVLAVDSPRIVHDTTGATTIREGNTVHIRSPNSLGIDVSEIVYHPSMRVTGNPVEFLLSLSREIFNLYQSQHGQDKPVQAGYRLEATLFALRVAHDVGWLDGIKNDTAFEMLVKAFIENGQYSDTTFQRMVALFVDSDLNVTGTAETGDYETLLEELMKEVIADEEAAEQAKKDRQAQQGGRRGRGRR